ncbi:hypothetical protein K402DRAFT_303207, partial [Aulographum hederae CBS 113979]
PRIACFHGGGSNAQIYQWQCARLADLLKDLFDFVYLDAPFTCGPGPGVLPTFADCTPFRSWFNYTGTDRQLITGSGWDDTDTSGVDRVADILYEEGKDDDAPEWIGVLAFSQGTRIAGGLLLDQQMRAAAGKPARTHFKFGVLCMGSFAPLLSETTTSEDHPNFTATSPSSSTTKEHYKRHPITIPTLHLHGLRDDQLNNGRVQKKTYYEEGKARGVEINYHHAMPWFQWDLEVLAEAVRDLHVE